MSRSWHLTEFLRHQYSKASSKVCFSLRQVSGNKCEHRFWTGKTRHQIIFNVNYFKIRRLLWLVFTFVFTVHFHQCCQKVLAENPHSIYQKSPLVPTKVSSQKSPHFAKISPLFLKKLNNFWKKSQHFA